MFKIPAKELTAFATALLSAGGGDGDEADLVARSLVESNLRGHDSHGVMRIPQYIDAVARGDLRPGANLTVLRETAILLAADGNWGFGQTQAQRLTRRLIPKAVEHGAAVGTLYQSGHIGRLGEYCEMAAKEHLVSMVMVNTHGHARRVAPPGGKAPRLGTNPIAFGIPHDDGPMVLDFGTSATAEGKVRVKKIAGQPCPDGWLIDSQGRPTNDPNDLYADPPGSILPFGGEQAHKGFGLGLVVEVFAGALSGGVCIREQPTAINGNCVFLLLLDPEYLGGAQHFDEEVRCLFQWVRSCPRVDGVDEIVLPGDPERRALQQRTGEGIPIDQGNWDQLLRLAERLGVAVPSIGDGPGSD
jgi:uncharacterized oxidoreductase